MRRLCERGFVAGCLALISGSTAWGEFVIDSSPDGQKLVVNKEESDGFSFSGTVGEKESSPNIYIKFDGRLTLWGDKEGGNSGKDGLASDIFIFIDDKDSFGFSEFSLRGQLDSLANGELEMIVTDNFDKVFDFKFTGLGNYEDFDRIGVVANTKGEYIKSIELKSVFKSEKDLEFSSRYLVSRGADGKEGSGDEWGDNGHEDGHGGDGGGGSGGGGGVDPNVSAVPEPSTFALLGIAGVAVAVSAMRGRRGKPEITL